MRLRSSRGEWWFEDPVDTRYLRLWRLAAIKAHTPAGGSEVKEVWVSTGCTRLKRAEERSGPTRPAPQPQFNCFLASFPRGSIAKEVRQDSASAGAASSTASSSASATAQPQPQPKTEQAKQDDPKTEQPKQDQVKNEPEQDEPELKRLKVGSKKGDGVGE